VLSETTFSVHVKSRDIVRKSLEVENHVVDANVITPDAEVQAIVEKWVALGDVLGEQVVGTASTAITGDASGDRGVETPMADLVADSILWGTQESGAEIAFMNVGGVRASLDPGDITYREAYNVMPFNNTLVTLEMTGAQIEAVLNQQFKGATLSRPVLAFGVSEGFTYEWTATYGADGKPTSGTVVPGSMFLNEVQIQPTETYLVSTLNFLADGGDGFSAFTQAGFVAGGPEDLANFVAYLQDQSPVSAPEDRVDGL
jgi:5'-nucleotidase